jgi:hypothetical protein
MTSERVSNARSGPAGARFGGCSSLGKEVDLFIEDKNRDATKEWRNTRSIYTVEASCLFDGVEGKRRVGGEKIDCKK